MHRFYTPQLKSDSGKIDIHDQSEVHHIRDVLRLKKGAQIELINGAGCVALGTITDLQSVAVKIQVENIYVEEPRLPRLTLACAIPKKGKFENIIEKTTELGVDEIIPLQTHNSDVVIKADKALHKQTRYQLVATNAAKQSHRSTIPQIHKPMLFREALTQSLQAGTVLIPSLTGNCRPISDVISEVLPVTQATIFIGPEGDFSVEEYELAHSNGCLAVTLGPTVLKVETAAITSVAILQFLADARDDSK